MNISKIKNLAKSLFFKVFIGILLLSFVFFGISNFMLNGGSSWVAKIGNEKISYKKLNQEVKNNRQAILQNNAQNPQAVEYVNSIKFQADILSRLINQAVISNLHSHFGFTASKKIILESIAKDQNFYKEGKFNNELFQAFLTQNNLDEDKYVEIIQNQITGMVVMNSISLISPVDDKIVQKLAALKEEKRIADVIKISLNNLPQSEKSDKKEENIKKLQEFSNNIANEVKKSPNDFAKIASKYNLKIEKNKSFPRFYYLEFQGQKVPYSNKFLEELFTLKDGELTSSVAVSNEEFNIGILRNIQKSNISQEQFLKAKIELANSYKTETLEEFNKFLQKEYPIKVNQKFIDELEKEAGEKKAEQK